jgi:uncharacterized membrane protein YheB (UPF0754 family)
MVAGPILLINFLWAAYRVVQDLNGDRIVALLLAVALIIIFFAARIMALRVQDRVIRLEMRLRLREVLPPDLTPRIGEFTTKQLVALRFASDAELPALARRVLDERLTDGKTIKQLVTDWQPDTLRA